MLTSIKLGVKIKKKRLSRMHLFMSSFTFSHCHYWVKKCYFPEFSPGSEVPEIKKAVRRTSERSERRNRTSGRMKSRPRSDELSPFHLSGTFSWSAQSQVTHHTLKQQIWQHNNCTVGLEALLTAWKSFLLIIK